MKIKKQISLLIGVFSVLLAPITKVLAQINEGLIETSARKAGISKILIPDMLASLIKFALSFVGTIFFIFIIYSGIQWMTAGGEEEKVTQATTRIKNASIGLAITAAAYFITYLIGKTVLNLS